MRETNLLFMTHLFSSGFRLPQSLSWLTRFNSRDFLALSLTLAYLEKSVATHSVHRFGLAADTNRLDLSM